MRSKLNDQEAMMSQIEPINVNEALKDGSLSYERRTWSFWEEWSLDACESFIREKNYWSKMGTKKQTGWIR